MSKDIGVVISIHAPTKGATSYHCNNEEQNNFNPRSHEGSDPKVEAAIHDYLISIHAPTKGATKVLSDNFLRLCNFNPRSHEGSDEDFYRVAYAHEFQSTLPRRERLSSSENLLTSTRFQSTLPRRERLEHITLTYRVKDFNPRSHEGSDSRSGVYYSQSERFQSTLPRRERQIRMSCRTQGQYFNPRSHEGSDQICSKLLRVQQISIHAPTKGATN